MPPKPTTIADPGPAPAPGQTNSEHHARPGEIENLDGAVARVGAHLATSFQDLLEHLPGAPHRPQELARKLGINKDLSSRILKATESKDPIAIAHLMPGPEPLRRLIRAAARKNVNGDVIQAAEDSVRQFELLIRNVAGDRGGLDTIISAWLPDVREKAELLSKQAVFKGMSQIKGTSAEVDFVTRFVHPAANGEGRDYVLLSGSLGLRRLRPGAAIAISSFRLHQPPHSAEPTQLLTLDGELVSNQHDVILEQFCSSPLPHFDIREEGVMTYMTMGGEEVGLKSAADVTWAHVHRSCHLRGVFSTVNMPARKGVCDLFLHPDITPRIEPILEIYDTTERGVATFRDPSRVLDRLDLKVNIDSLGVGVSHFRCTEIPRYIEMITHVCRMMNWDASAFLGYRCAIDYPLYGSQVSMVFDPSISNR